MTAEERLDEVIADLREFEGLPVPRTFTSGEAEELGFLIDELDRVRDQMWVKK